MNLLSFDDALPKIAHYIRAAVRFVDPHRAVDAFSRDDREGAIGRIIVINLDRKPLRWRRTRSELRRFRDRNGRSLDTLARRFSAVDARYMSDPPPSDLTPSFTLAEQLIVNPDPLLSVDDDASALVIEMTRPEVAVAMSHIAVWRGIAAGDAQYSLVLEDDAIMRPGFARRFNRDWPTAVAQSVDLLYLAYRNVGGTPGPRQNLPTRRTGPGLWEASAYVLSRSGAQALLDLLPAHGPIDLWLNFVVDDLTVFTTSRPVMEQRLAEPSTNSYSVLPIFSQVGLVTRERPLLPAALRLPGPVIVDGEADGVTSSLALALSMLGYRTVCNLDVLPPTEQARLERGSSKRIFDAYVNVGSVRPADLANNPNASFITTRASSLQSLPADRTLRITHDTSDKWAALTNFLGLEYPSFSFPETEEATGPGQLASAAEVTEVAHTRDLRWDQSPWIVPGSNAFWQGIATSTARQLRRDQASWSHGEPLDETHWRARNDTFPSNLALFRPSAVTLSPYISLRLEAQKTSVRDYVAGAIAGQPATMYGTYSAELRPARGSGIVSGLFLHRNAPRQEIDIEFLGRNTQKMLVNVYYNPGPIGTKLEYGYRGTPTEIDLGFDAADDFHLYEIDWQPDRITWKVDGRPVYSRWQWNPTPIPDQPLEFNINIWTSRSVEFAGPLDPAALPCETTIRRMSVNSTFISA